MVRNFSERVALLVLTTLTLQASLFAQLSNPQVDYSYTAGKDKDLPNWYGFKPMSFNDARKTNKPILLYVYDDATKVNSAAKTLETIFFKNPAEKNCFVIDPALKTALSGFTVVWVSKSTSTWPDLYTQNVNKTFAMYILLSNGVPVASYEKGKTPNKNTFIQTTQMALAANPGIIEQMKKNPPPDWAPPPPPGQLAAAKEAEEKPMKEDKVSALLEKDSKAAEAKGMPGGKKPEAAKAGEPKKPAKPLDEKLKDEEEKRALPESLAHQGKTIYVI